MTRPDVPDWAALLLANLKRGRDNAQTYAVLSEQMGVTPRVLHEAVRQLRLQEYPVDSGGEGIWIEETSEGMFDLYRRLRSRSLEGMRTAAAVKRAAFRQLGHEEKFEQECIWWPERAA